MTTTFIDYEVIEQFLDFAAVQSWADNGYGEGFWTGRAIQHASQNAIAYSWLKEEMFQRGLDPEVVPNDPEEDA